MGFLDRLKDAAIGFGGALQAPFGLVKDLSLAPFTDDDEWDGFIGTIYGSMTSRGAQLMSGAVGPHGGLGTLIGGMPEDVRSPARTVINPVLGGLEFAYREGVGEPLSTLMTMGSLVDAPGSQGLGVFFDGQSWRKAYKIAQHRSPGQAIALAILTKDIQDREETARAVGTDWYDLISGVSDAVIRWELDPAAVAGKAARFYRKGAEVGSIGMKGTEAEQAAYSQFRREVVTGVRPAPQGAWRLARLQRQFDKVVDASKGMTASEIESTFFANKALGGQAAYAIANAADDTERRMVWQALLGDHAIAQELYDKSVHLGNVVAKLNGDLAGTEQLIERGSRQWAAAHTRTLVRKTYGYKVEIPGSSRLPSPRDSSLVSELRERAAKMQAEVDQLYGEMGHNARIIQVTGTLQQFPKLKATAAARTAITHSDWYNAPYSTPLRKVFQMREHTYINLEDPFSHTQVKRMLEGSTVPLAEQDTLWSKYVGALNPGEREEVFHEVSDRVLKSVVDDANARYVKSGRWQKYRERQGVPEGNPITESEIAQMVGTAYKHRAKTYGYLRSRSYSGEGQSLVKFMSDTGDHMVEMPLLKSQTANILPIPNFDLMRKAVRGIGRFKARHPNADIPMEMLDKFYSVWKPMVLLRVGWPLRVVGEEQLRMLAKIGALGNKDTWKAAFHQGRLNAGTARADLISAVHEGGLRTGLKNAWRDMKTPSVGQDVIVDGVLFPHAFGTPGESLNVFHALNSSGTDWARIYGISEKIPEGLRKTGMWDTLVPDSPGYGAAWEHAVNHQLGGDVMARKLMAGESVDDVVSWLRTTPEGIAYARAMPLVRRRNMREWVEQTSSSVDGVLPTPALREAALARKATAKQLEREIPNAAGRPVVNGEMLDQALGKSQTTQFIQDKLNDAMEMLGKSPTDVLSRNRYFDTMYMNEVRRQALNAKGAGVAFTPELQERIAMNARRYALRESRTLLYDLAEDSRFGEMARYFMPFFPAWQEVVTRWAGLAVENPAFIRRMQLVWQAPEKAGIVQDENGLVIGEDKGPYGKERYVTFPLPKWAKDVPIVGRGLETAGSVKFSKGAINMVLQGPPGFSPLVQIPVNEIVKARPELEDSVKFMLPFGTTQSIMQIMLPATAKRGFSLARGEEDVAFRNAALRIYYDEVVNYNTGLRKTQPKWDEALSKARSLYMVRAFASFVSPAAVQFNSPYQVFIDAYRRRKERDAKLTDEQRRQPNYKTPDEWFLDKYGKDFFPLTESLSKSVDGVPPTVEGYYARKKYLDLVEKYPEFGMLIVGKEGAGEFSRSVYDYQLSHKVAPGSDRYQRERKFFEEAEGDPGRRLGWIEYRKGMDLIEAERVHRGLPNLQVKAASDLAQMKRDLVQSLADKYPSWEQDYMVTDPLRNERLISLLRETVADRRLKHRQDMRGVQEYLDARDMFGIVLGSSEAKTLSAASNQALAEQWRTTVADIVERNLPFADLYYRWLEFDQPEATT